MVATSLAALFAPSCDRGSPATEKPDSAPLRVVATSPKDNQTDVAPDAPILVRFDRFLRPETAIRQSLRVTGGTIDAATGAAIAGEAFLEPTYDPVERVVAWRLPAGSQWSPGIRYTVTVWAARDHEGSGVLAWDGQQLDASVAFGFTSTATPPAAPAALPTPAAYCSTCSADNKLVVGARDVLATCTSGSCHGPGLVYKAGEMGLDLSSAAAIEATALGRPAHGTLTGTSSTDSERNPYVFGVGMPLIDPGNPGNSYLLFKTLINPENYVRSTKSDVLTSDQPVDGSFVPDAAELVRLSNGFVKGDPMPVGYGIGLDRLRVLQAWIAAGAPLQDHATCPDTTACEPKVGGPPVHPVAMPVYSRDIKPILSVSCAGGGCHSPPSLERDLDFTGSPSGFVNKKRKSDLVSEIIVVPNDPTKSFLLNKLRGHLGDRADTPEVEMSYGLACEGPPNRCGDRMPLLGMLLTDDQIQTIENWIAQGAADL